MALQWSRSPGKKGSHFDPNSNLFVPSERNDIITSTACWIAMVALLGCLSVAMGPLQLLKLYGIPYLVSLASITNPRRTLFSIRSRLLRSVVFFQYHHFLMHSSECSSICSCLSCGWTWSHTCITMVTMTNFLGIVERYADLFKRSMWKFED